MKFSKKEIKKLNGIFRQRMFDRYRTTPNHAVAYLLDVILSEEQLIKDIAKYKKTLSMPVASKRGVEMVELRTYKHGNHINIKIAVRNDKTLEWDEVFEYNTNNSVRLENFEKIMNDQRRECGADDIQK